MAIIAARRVRKRKKRRDWTRIWRKVRRHINTVERKLLIKEFNKRVANWDDEPKFIAKMNKVRDDFVLSVRPVGKNAKKWNWVSRGTKGPYKIKAKNAPTLNFKKNYDPRTKPGDVFGLPAVSWGPWQSPVEVTHPGIEPRLFEEEIAKIFAPEFRRRINNLIRREIRKN